MPRSLPIFKRFIRIITNSSGGNDSEMVVMQVRSCLSSILQILDNAKYFPPHPFFLQIALTRFDRIRGDAALPCLKNCLMASTIVITAGVNVLPPNDEQVPLLCDRMIDALSNPAVSLHPQSKYPNHNSDISTPHRPPKWPSNAAAQSSWSRPRPPAIKKWSVT